MSDQESEQILAAFERHQSRLRCGSLRFWGEWFGRPGDNCHRFVQCRRVESGVVIFVTDAGEKLTVYGPSDFVMDESTFIVRQSDRIVWEWGASELQDPESTSRLDFVRHGDTVVMNSSDGRFRTLLQAAIEFPAVEIL